MNKLLVLFCLAGAAIFLAGCGQADYPVSGTVTFDGERVSDGDILFCAVDQSVGPAAGKIKDGEFHLRAKPGKMRVEIRAARPVGQNKLGMGPEFQDYIPPEFNSKSKRVEEVKAGGDNRFEFTLHSSKRP